MKGIVKKVFSRRSREEDPPETLPQMEPLKEDLPDTSIPAGGLVREDSEHIKVAKNIDPAEIQKELDELGMDFGISAILKKATADIPPSVPEEGKDLTSDSAAKAVLYEFGGVYRQIANHFNSINREEKKINIIIKQELERVMEAQEKEKVLHQKRLRLTLEADSKFLVKKEGIAVALKELGLKVAMDYKYVKQDIKRTKKRMEYSEKTLKGAILEETKDNVKQK